MPVRNQLAWLARAHGFTTYIKVPCRAATVERLLARDEEAVWSARYHLIASPEAPFAPTAASVDTMRTRGGIGIDTGIQDLLIIDSRDEALRALPALGRASCQSSSQRPKAKRRRWRRRQKVRPFR